MNAAELLALAPTPKSVDAGDIVYDKTETYSDGTVGKAIQTVDDVLSPFIVTFTPTAEDFSGTTDRTNAEIAEAYDAGRQIVFSIPGMNEATVNAHQFIRWGVEHEYVTAATQIIYTIGNDVVFIQIVTGNTDYVYSTLIFALTPYGT